MLHVLAIAPLLIVLSPARADEGSDGTRSEVTVRGLPLTVTRELELQAGLYRAPYGGMNLPLSGSFLIDATTARRDRGAMADLTLGADPLGPDAVAALRGLEIYRRDEHHPLSFRVGRLNLVRGGRFRFVDGADVAYAVTKALTVAAWAGTAWHPERTAFASGGPTWGFDLGHRPAGKLGGGLRYEHVALEEGGGIERVGGDMGLHLPSLSDLRVDARFEAASSEAPLELAALAGGLRPHHRLLLRVEGGYSHPTSDSLGRGGVLFPMLMTGPTGFLDGTARLALEQSVLGLALGGLLLSGDEDEPAEPGWRASITRSGHAGRPLVHVVRVSGLDGPGGTASALLLELGHGLGPIDLSVLGEQAVFRYDEQDWRAMTVLGTRASTAPSANWRLSLLAQLSMGQGEEPEGQLWLVATQRVTHGRPRRPAPERDRFLAPTSPSRWVEEDMPRSPGTVPGADPYPSVPMPEEVDDAG